jgi:hypothetical protein
MMGLKLVGDGAKFVKHVLHLRRYAILGLNLISSSAKGGGKPEVTVVACVLLRCVVVSRCNRLRSGG